MASDGGGARDGEEGWGGGTRNRVFSDYVPAQPQLQMLTTATTTTTLTSPALDRERSAYGVGGKSVAIRKSGRRSVPYERPVVGRHAAAGPQAAAIIGAASAQALAERAHGGGTWRLGSGFSKIITNGATYLYSSIFRRHLPAPLPAALQVSNVEAQELDADEQISSPSVDVDDIQGGNRQVGHVQTSDQREPEMTNSGLSDVENLMQKKTLSRDEFQRLTALLQSRVVSNGVEKKKQQPKHVEFDLRPSRQEVHTSGGNQSESRSQSEAQRWRQDLQKSREERENGVRTLTVYENGRPSPATPARAPETLDALGGSPVEVAIAFMGGRASQQAGTSPAESLNQLDESRLSSGPPPSVHTTTLAKLAPPDFQNDDHFHTPPPQSVHARGRDRTISRTPYSRPLRVQPPRERAVDGTFGTPSASRWTPIRTPVTGGREMLKRRSTVLEEGWTSGGPIRRTRHKAIVPVTPLNLSQSRGSSFPVTPIPGSSLMTLPSPIGGRLSPRNVGSSRTKEKDVLRESGNFYVPAQSSETARKILETLEKMTPSPKGKALGEELAHVRDRPPTTLTEGMLNDQARKSMTFVEYAVPSDSREPGPSVRGVEESPSSGYPATFKMSDPKVKGKGKASLSPTENGPSVLGASSQEKISVGDGSTKQISVRPKESDSMLASENDKGKGFRMNAVFEESGSEDEGRLAKTNPSTLALPVSTSKLPNATAKSSTVGPTMFGITTFSSTTATGAGLSSFPVHVTDVDTSKTVSSGFTFSTRVPLDGPPTPKAMSSASASPKLIPAIPYFQFAKTSEPLAASGSALELSSTVGRQESQTENKPEFSFGSPPAPVVSVTLPVPKLQPPLESKVPNMFKQSSSFFGAPSSTAAPAIFSTLTPAVASSPVTASSSSKLGDTFVAPTSSSSLKVGASTSPFPVSSSSSLFGTGSGAVQSASGIAPSAYPFASNSGAGTTSSNLFVSNNASGTSGALAPGSSGFGQLNSFSFKHSSTTSGSSLSPDSQASGAKDSTMPSMDPERPQKRSMSSFQQDPMKRQQPAATVPSHSFTTFGTSIGTSAAAPAIPVTFAASSSSMTTSPGLFSSSFGQASSSALQSLTASPSAAPIPFAFGPTSTAASTSSASSSAGFGNAPSFPSFPSPVFGTTSSGSTFGATPAAPMALGSTSTTPAFGSSTAIPVFGRFASEPGSQSTSMPVFGSGFSSQSPSTPPPSFPFGASSPAPAFSFGGGAVSSPSGAAFNFGSSGSFSFTANKSGSASPPPSIFGLSSSVPAFGSTTNGTMASDVVVNDQLNMDDNSMAEEPSQIGGSVPPQPSMFGALSSAGTSSFVFGAQTGAPGATGPTIFGGFPPSTNPSGFAAAPANPFAQTGGSLDFDPPTGGAFALGSGGDRPTRKMFKAKRTGAKRGK